MKQRDRQFHTPFVIAAVLTISIVAVYYLNKRGQIPESWPVTQADIVETRTGPKYVQQTRAAARIMYGSDYRLKYLIDGKEYFLWIDSGIRARDRELAGRITQQIAKKKCQVKYNPEKPSEAYVVFGSFTQ
jgi:hypothetical protein